MTNTSTVQRPEYSQDATKAGRPAASEVFRTRMRRRVVLFATLLVLLVGVVLFSVSVGQYHIPVGDVPRILIAGPEGASLAESVVWKIRLPRLVLGLLVGAALVIVFNITIFGTSTVPAAAFITAVATTAVVYQLARHDGRVHVINLILTGIAINAVAGAIISFLVYLAPTTSREQIIFWQMGSLNGSQWKHVIVVAPIIIVGAAISLHIGGQLDALALGEKAAGHIGINVSRLRITAIGASTLLTAGAVAYAGLIGFVGLIVPHLLRGITGPANKVLIPASALAGAVLIGLSDIAARTLIPFADLPIGIFTALVGGPTFFILLRRMLMKGRH